MFVTLASFLWVAVSRHTSSKNIDMLELEGNRVETHSLATISNFTPRAFSLKNINK